MAVADVESDSAIAIPPIDSLRSMLVELLPVLRVVARGLCRNAAEVEDLVQDTFEKALRSIGSVDVTRNPRGWMVTILHNLHIDRCRELARRQTHVPVDDVPLVQPEPATVPAWSEMTVDDVRRAADALPDDLRAVYVPFALEGKSYIEIAEALGIPKATVGTRLLRARTQLKLLLSSYLETRTS